MHEAHVIRDVIAKAVAAAAGARVAALHLRLGALSPESPEHLSHHFGLAAAGTPLAGARLWVERTDEPTFDVRLTAIDVEDR